MRRLLVVGNWKMNKTPSEAGPFVGRLSERVRSTESVEVVIAPPFTALSVTRQALGDRRPFGLAAQDLYWEDKGPFTGEISPPMLTDLGCEYVILGHSERRQHFGEGDSHVNRKVQAALRHRVSPILCLGETLDERESGKTESVVMRQLTRGLEGFEHEAVSQVTIAYEPLWAIGTGHAASVEQAGAVHDFLRAVLARTWGADIAGRVRVLYGGSVTPENANTFMASPSIDGTLVGAACLDVDTFARIIEAAQGVAAR